MDQQTANIITQFFALILSLSLHEAAHAFAAKIQGDDTAEREGRLTLNPFPHLDPIGTVLLPLMMMFAGGGFFGWAKPVPVDDRNFKSPRLANALVSLAGPFSNLAFSVLAMLALHYYSSHLSESIRPGHFLYPTVNLLQSLVLVNAVLAFFNLVPLPPLDGGTFLGSLLSGRAREAWQQYIEPMGSWILLLVVISGGLSFVSVFTRTFIIATSEMIANSF